MLTPRPNFDVICNGTELTDAAIEALAALFLDAADRARKNEDDSPSGLSESALEGDECIVSPRGGP